MKKKVLLVLLAMLVGMTMIMASCGGGGSTPEEPMTLEKYVKDDAEVVKLVVKQLGVSPEYVENLMTPVSA